MPPSIRRAAATIAEQRIKQNLKDDKHLFIEKKKTAHKASSESHKQAPKGLSVTTQSPDDRETAKTGIQHGPRATDMGVRYTQNPSHSPLPATVLNFDF
mmetsp:Transcript_3885/g.5098  ORF Transcript_3885/g.5098 Transcript_3885/m.5098 type:complete len:99 (+) Transcript_3885:241-537(+)|eukprot:CAMPEP_0198152260 /NCGR_PEP_ID=MMETSP1443-20131203/59092_1 /TAXON_ID=186043 /ORGANISM="Entomoneis sp., Strain CCMP2396" /LENGTH=98 /DNA_ID=CAMNT_0043818219 /DNA_START=154 /DNA_END=450 /DNA_ORIENTATION=+